MSGPEPMTAGRRAPDARVAILLSLVFGVLVWRSGPLANAAFAAFFVGVLAATGTLRRDGARLVRAVAGPVLGWSAVNLLLALLAGRPAAAAVAATGLLALRLATLVLLGAALHAVATPRALGLAVASLLRPALRDRAWTVALSLSLMIHLVPLTFAAFERARAGLRSRRVAVSRPRALLLVLRAGARNLAEDTWAQALALAARRLDRPEAWSEAAPARPLDWAAGALVAALAVAVARA